MNKNDLDELETYWRLGGLSDCHDLLRNGRLMELVEPARMGLWAREQGIMVLKNLISGARNCIIADNKERVESPAYTDAAKKYIAQALAALEVLPKDKI